MLEGQLLWSPPRAAGTGPSPCEQQRLQTAGPLTTANGVFQMGKLRSELEMVSGNVRVMSEMLTELVPTQAEPADLELLQVSTRRPAGDLLLTRPHPSLPHPHCSFHSLLRTPWSPWEMLKPGTLDSISDWNSAFHSFLV